MKTRCILTIIKLSLAFILVLPLLPWAGIAAADATLDEQLIEAASGKDLKIVKTLLDKGANPNARDSDGRTVLILAATRRRTDVVEFLIREGADLNAKGKHGETALMSVMTLRSDLIDFRLAKLLLDGGAEVDARDKDGCTALMYLFRRIIKITSESSYVSGANRIFRNAKVKYGPRALVDRAQYTDIIGLLLEKGAEFGAHDKKGKSALTMCSEPIVEIEADLVTLDDSGKGDESFKLTVNNGTVFMKNPSSNECIELLRLHGATE
jgi:ankyrin repeat protein